jgi:hypothetical protein
VGAVIISITDPEIGLPPDLPDPVRQERLAKAHAAAMAALLKRLNYWVRKGQAKVSHVLESVGVITVAATRHVILELGNRADVHAIELDLEAGTYDNVRPEVRTPGH